MFFEVLGSLPIALLVCILFGVRPAGPTSDILFAWLISRTFSVNEQYFSLTTNQPTVLSAMAYQPSGQGNSQRIVFLIYDHSVNDL